MFLTTPWSFEPGVAAGLLLAALLYALGARRTSARPWRLGLRPWRIAACTAGLLTVAFALFSPVDTLSGDLFWMHSVQHLLLMTVAAPLLVLGDLPLMTLRALPRAWSHSLGSALAGSRLWRALTSPVAAWLLFALSMWVWHAPLFYQAALRDAGLHALEHFSILLTSILFWWIVLRPSASQHLHYGMAVAYLFTTAMHSGILGALMTFSAYPWYPYYATRTAAWGMTALQDQQLGGLLMWMPGGLIFSLATIGYFAAWLRAMEKRDHIYPLR